MSSAALSPQPSALATRLRLSRPGLAVAGHARRARRRASAACATTFAEASDGAGVDLWALSQGRSRRQCSTAPNTPSRRCSRPASRCGARGGAAAARSRRNWPGTASANTPRWSRPARCRCATPRTSCASAARLMQDAAPAGTGAMAAVLGADDALVARRLRDVSGEQVVVPANYNSPGQIVIGGHAQAVDRGLGRTPPRAACARRSSWRSACRRTRR